MVHFNLIPMNFGNHGLNNMVEDIVLDSEL